MKNWRENKKMYLIGIFAVVILVAVICIGRVNWVRTHTYIGEAEPWDISTINTEEMVVVDELKGIDIKKEDIMDNTESSDATEQSGISTGNAYIEQANQVKELTANVDYVENQLVALADSKKDAKKIAEQLSGTLDSYKNGLAVIYIPGTVYDTLMQLSEMEDAPEVYPTYLYSIQ